MTTTVGEKFDKTIIKIVNFADRDVAKFDEGLVIFAIAL